MHERAFALACTVPRWGGDATLSHDRRGQDAGAGTVPPAPTFQALPAGEFNRGTSPNK